MKRHPFPLKSLAAAVLLCVASGAQAQIDVYTDRTAFLAAVGGYGVDTYDDLAVQLYESPFARSAGSYGYTASADSGLYGAGSGGDGWLTPNVDNEAIIFSNFAPGIVGFGGYFFGSDINGAFVPNGTLQFTATDGSTLDYTLTGATTTSFVGFVSSSPLASVSLISGGDYWATANDVTLAMPIPEPETYAMMMLGLGVVGWMRRRRG
ncbi:PEP-CTERM sorting domain-containing protein [Massilia sp.]|uniref:PEP-CTERM sorting domain-containing protein n=1 Tax=Massilia sp. TaxID=1882437 RepID=UPI0028AEDE76|nr:PEP-CTERM sorting domain-containing protein [Massilia sp.]